MHGSQHYGSVLNPSRNNTPPKIGKLGDATFIPNWPSRVNCTLCQFHDRAADGGIQHCPKQCSQLLVIGGYLLSVARYCHL